MHLFIKSESNRFSAINMTAKQLMLLGWNIGSYQLSGASAWFYLEGFDIEATAGRAVSWGEMQLMLRSLLSERFSLSLHSEMKEAPIYALTTGKGGMKIRLSGDQTLWAGDLPSERGATGATMDNWGR